MDRNARSDLHQRRSSVGRRARATRAVEFFNVLTSPELLQTSEALLPEHRERLYPPTVTLSMFMRQVLESDGSCQKAVNGWAAQRAADGLAPCSVRTGRVLPGTPAPAAGDAQHAHARNRPPAQREGACAMALAWARGQAGGRHWTVDTRYPAEPSHLSPTEHPGPRGRLSPGATCDWSW